MASSKPEFYGLVAGKAGATFAKNINTRLYDSQITKTWDFIEDLQKDVNTNGDKAITGLKAILIIDKGFNTSKNTSIESRGATFNFLQGMFNAKELYGTHLILFTQEPGIYTSLTNQYDLSPETKYEGTLLLETMEDYTVKSLISVFEKPLDYLSYADKEAKDLERQMAKQKRNAEDKEKRTKANRHFLKLVGRKESLEMLLETFSRELKILDKEIYQYAINLQSENLDVLEDEFEDSVAIDLAEQLKKLS